MNISKIDKKKLYIIISVIAAVILLATGLILAFYHNPSSVTNQKVTVSKVQADDYKQQAISALEKKNTAKARDLFEKAKNQYSSLNDSANVVDMDAQIYLIDHPSGK